MEAFHHPLTVYHNEKIYPLRNLYTLYLENPEEYNAIPEKDVKLGKQNVRTYCGEHYRDWNVLMSDLLGEGYATFLGLPENS